MASSIFLRCLLFYSCLGFISFRLMHETLGIQGRTRRSAELSTTRSDLDIEIRIDEDR